MPIIFKGGQVLPATRYPTLIAWLYDKEHMPSESGGVPAPVVPRYEESWLLRPSQEWNKQGLLHKMTLRPMPNAPGTTMLILNGPQTSPPGIDNYFYAVAGATEQVAGWQVPDNSELEKWAAQLGILSLNDRAQALVRWIAALDYLANR